MSLIKFKRIWDVSLIKFMGCVPDKIHKIFDLAINKVGSVWQVVASGVMASDETYLAKIGTTWNLDTGRDERDQLVFWG